MSEDDLTEAQPQESRCRLSNFERSPIFGRGDLVDDRYEIERFVSQGGMGQVYEALDRELCITVGLKALRPELVANEAALRRFKDEVQLARQIAHQNVCRIFDLGRHAISPSQLIVFLTMEFLRGPTLEVFIAQNGKLPPAEALCIIRQLCEGLAAAHRRGIIHRDFKTSNVMLEPSETGGNCVKITDFGLARRLVDARTGAKETAVGTPAYMAPEQLFGRSSTATDIYSLGIVMCEMITGSLPFSDHGAKFLRDPYGLTEDLLKSEKGWISVIHKCLDPAPERRYQSALEVLDALEHATASVERRQRLKLSRRHAIATAVAGIGASSIAAFYIALERAASPAHAINSIAVVPLANHMTGEGTDYISDGMTEGLIASLSHLNNVRLMSRSAVTRLKGASADPIHAGEQLHVGAVLAGSMDGSSTEPKVSLELVLVSNGARLWGNDFRVSDYAELARIPLQVTDEIGRVLNKPINPEKAADLSQQVTPNSKAYRNYLRGRYEWNKRTLEGYQKASVFFKAALEDDPAFALAYTGLADSYSFQGGFLSPDEVFPRARGAAERALQLNEQLAEAHTSLGFVFLQYDWSWKRAETEFKRAIQLNFNYATAHSMYSRLLSVLGRFRLAFEELSCAQTLDPLSVGIALNLGFLSYLSRKYDEAIAAFKQTLDLEPTYSDAESYLAYVLTAKGNLGSASKIYEKILHNQVDDPGLLADAARCNALAGRRAEAKRLFRRLEKLAQNTYVPASLQAEVCAAMQKPNEAFIHLEKAISNKAWPLIYLKVEPVWDPLRTDSRFRNLLQRMNLSN